MGAHESELKKKTVPEDWEYFAHLIHTFALEMETNRAENQKLQKELQMIKKVVHSYISSEKGREKFVSTKFLVKLYKTVQTMKKRVDDDEGRHAEFISFLRTLLEKMKQEKLVAYKTFEKTREFQKHKRFGDIL